MSVQFLIPPHRTTATARHPAFHFDIFHSDVYFVLYGTLYLFLPHCKCNRWWMMCWRSGSTYREPACSLVRFVMWMNGPPTLNTFFSLHKQNSLEIHMFSYGDKPHAYTNTHTPSERASGRESAHRFQGILCVHVYYFPVYRNVIGKNVQCAIRA